MVMLGTFIVRSGLLTSVHAFAVDPGRGFYLLLMLATAAVGAVGLIFMGVRGGPFAVEPMEVNREGALLLNNLLLMTLFIAVLAGTLAPTGIELLGGETYVVRESYFNPTFAYPSLILLALMALGVHMGWTRIGVRGLIGLLMALGVLAAVFSGLAVWTDVPVRGGLIAALGFWVLGSTLWAWTGQVRAVGFGRLSHHGWALAHAGLAIAFLGMGAASLIKQERSYEMNGPMTFLMGR